MKFINSFKYLYFHVKKHGIISKVYNNSMMNIPSNIPFIFCITFNWIVDIKFLEMGNFIWKYGVSHTFLGCRTLR